MTRYFIFSNPGSKEKYTEVSEQRFINEVINSKTRYYISFNYVLLECSREEFKADQAEKDRSRYISQLSTGVYPTFFSFDEDMDQFEDLCDNEDDDAYEQAAVALFWKYVSTLSKDKQLVLKLFYKHGKTQAEIAKAIGKTQQAVSYICTSAISKFNKDYKK